MSDSQNTSTGVKFEVTIGGGPVETTDVMSVTVDHDHVFVVTDQDTVLELALPTG